MDHSQHSIHNNHDVNMNHDHGANMGATTIDPIQAQDVESRSHMHTEEGGMIHQMMSMSFHFGCNETILFSFWNINSVGGLLGSCFFIFLVAILYEGLKYYREFLFWKTYNLLEYRPVTGPQRIAEDPQRATPSSSVSPVQYVGEVIHKQPPTMLSVNHLIQTFLHIIQTTVSFMLMLIFMTYNVWLCIAVVLGAGVGYFFFCWKKSVIVDVTEHCH
ncbi:high affinity copper uptake protein 1 isoform X2 [Teleopsis dalmanni]|uniref:high affinity copper uptake protein 1 isoform X2 n=1 Tax=Teleopsis dalmanni TaxID=139649 RepID=UPI0018CD7531|nr:high affinity copper uptake protein 1 isoform X2 [Teleopsis dalmanni]